ncbi:MAG: hypothetical protein R2752_01450 [Vicinamibacterales bacterium]
MTFQPAPPSARRLALGVFALLLVVYNLNGRETGTTDSQPAKFTAREVAVRGTLTLDAVVAQFPGLGERPAFARDRQGHVRSAYPLLPALIAAVPATILQRTGVVDMDAPLAPNLIAALTASTLTAAACALLCLALLRLVTPRAAVATTMVLGLGTNYWALVSQTLWQHETVAFGLALALWAWLRPADELRGATPWLGGLGLAMAGAARPQVTPLVVVLLAWFAARTSPRAVLRPALVVGLAGATVVATNLWWFGHPLGATPRLEALHPVVHGVAGSLSRTPWIGALGLLVSPSRGLLVFSPVVLVALAGVGPLRGSDWQPRWLLIALGVQFAAYAAYTVWWAGHTWGPRYLLDLLPLATPFAAAGGARLWRAPTGRAVIGLLTAWSVVVAGLGAFVYPNENWNSAPAGVDLHHERLWDVGDSQILRAMRSAPSPQNFSLWDRAAIRRP